MTRFFLLVFCVLSMAAVWCQAGWELHPSEFSLRGKREALQLIATWRDGDRVADHTRGAEYVIADSAVVSVSRDGVVRPRSNGVTTIRLGESTVKVRVSGIQSPAPVSFRHETLPVLSRLGCSAGSCHGSPHGKGSFRLSLRAFDPALDGLTLVSEELGRRTNPIEPDKSLLLLKPTTAVSHEGGKKLDKESEEYALLRSWIAEGAALRKGEESTCTGIEIYPSESRVLHFPDANQQFSVQAKFSDGTRRDVTHLAVFESSNTKVAEVSRQGLVSGVERGGVAVIARYLEFIESTSLTFVKKIDGFEWADRKPANYVDEHVYRKLRQLQFAPSQQSEDLEFVRRVYLDVTGQLPSAEAIGHFVEDRDPRKRALLIDTLLEGEDHASFWAQKWGDLLRVSKKQIGHASVFKFSRWLVNAVSSNMPYDEFAREILTARGSSLVYPAANYYRAAGNTFDAMETSAQLFLGSRIQCAKCHNHPFERWTQDNYYGLAAFFNRVERKKTGKGEELIVYSRQDGEVSHPATGETMKPWAPKAGEMEVEQSFDRRDVFTEWLTGEDNPFFAQVEANRIWSYLLGRGIVEPFDDFRDTNPPSNPPLLKALAQDFRQSGYDRRHLLRVILNSNTYQAASETNQFNRDDRTYFSHYQPRMLTAEQLVDALGVVTGRPMKFEGVPPELRATELPAPDLRAHNRGRIGEVEFMKVFGQPERQTICECERGDESSLGQALQMYNGQLIHDMITAKDGHLHQWIREGLNEEEIVRKLYFSALCRPPGDKELALHLQYIRGAENATTALEDTLWIVLNKSEFLFQH